MAADDSKDAWAALVKGGHIALIRHGNAPPGYGGDPPGFKIDDCKTQRNLAEISEGEPAWVVMACSCGGRAARRIVGEEFLDRIVYAVSPDTARTAWTAFERAWGKRCPGVVTSLQEGGAELLTFFSFPQDPVENAAHDQQPRTVERGVPPPRQDAGLAADRSQRGPAPFRARGHGADHAAQARRLHAARRGHPAAGAARRVNRALRGGYPSMAGTLNVTLEPIAGPRPHAVLPSVPLTSRKNARSQFPHQAGHHPLCSSKRQLTGCCTICRLPNPLTRISHDKRDAALQVGPDLLVAHADYPEGTRQHELFLGTIDGLLGAHAMAFAIYLDGEAGGWQSQINLDQTNPEKWTSSIQQ